MCNGPLVLLGVLGHLRWFRCRNCGMDQCKKVKKTKAKRKENDDEQK